MKRDIQHKLVEWKNSPDRKPLILWGARQVGKTYSLKEFGRKSFQNYIYISFYNNSQAAKIFDTDYEPKRIIDAIQLISGQQAVPGKSLIIFDEVQGAPRVVESLKYFCEEAPEYHVVCAGSLLGVALHEGISFPVGKVDILTLHPMSFTEFLVAHNNKRTAEAIQSCDFQLTGLINDKLINELKLYFAIGGMPGVVEAHRSGASLEDVRQRQLQLLQNYEGDFGKHISPNDLPRTRLIWNNIPLQLGKENKKFFYGQIKSGARAKDYENALFWLSDCGLVHKIYKVQKPEIPLKAYVNQSAFKLFMIDVGLLCALAEVDINTIAYNFEDMQQFKGAIAEQFVCQEIVANTDLPLYYYASEKSTYEIDFLTSINSEIVPIEVKGGKNVASKSLKMFCEKFNVEKAVKTSLLDYADHKNVLNLPLWAVSCINKCVK